MNKGNTHLAISNKRILKEALTIRHSQLLFRSEFLKLVFVINLFGRKKIWHQNFSRIPIEKNQMAHTRLTSTKRFTNLNLNLAVTRVKKAKNAEKQKHYLVSKYLFYIFYL